ncbi:MAG: YcnI family protein, partial [Planctomycetota bacterium]
MGRLVGSSLALVALMVPSIASAHVGIEPETAPAGSDLTFTIYVPHGCDESPTEEVAIKLPASVRAAWPAPAAGWDLEATPVGEASGDAETAQRLEIVRWSGGRIPDGELGEFRIRLALPDDPGAVLAIPAIQTCEDGETRWIQVPAEGERADDLPEPAPTITLTASAAADVDPPGADDGRPGLALGLAIVAVVVAV